MASPDKLGAGIDKNDRGPKDRRLAWSERILDVVCSWLRRSGPLVEILQNRRSRGEQALWAEAKKVRGDIDDGDDGENHCALAEEGGNLSIVDDLSRVVGVLSFLGGHVEGLHPGAKVICRMPCRETDKMKQEWDNGFAEEEAIVLRLGLSHAPIEGTSGRTSLREPERNAKRKVQTERDVVRDPAQEARPGFASPDAAQAPSSVYDYLADDGHLMLSTSAVARAVVRANQHRQRVQEQLPQQQPSGLQQERQLEGSEDVPVCTPFSSQGSVVRGDGQEQVMLRSSNSSHAGSSPSSAGPSSRGRFAAGPLSLLKPVQDRCDEYLTIGRVRGGHENTPEVATVPIDSVKLAQTKVPRELTMALKPYAEEFVPHLKALLEADTAFRGA